MRLLPAAARLTLHAELLFKLFGPEALMRPLRFSDLSKSEQNEIKAGIYQILPSRDRAGRLVAFNRGNNTEGITNNNRVRLNSILLQFLIG